MREKYFWGQSRVGGGAFQGGRLGPLLVALSVGLHGERVAELAIARRSHRSRPANHPALSCRGVRGKIKTWQS